MLKVKPLPETEALFTVTLEPPELVTVAIFCMLVPTWSVPNETELPASVPGVVVPPPELELLPTPVSEIDDNVCAAAVAVRRRNPKETVLPLIARLALLVPLACGEKVTLKLALPFESSVIGRLRPLTLKSPLLEATCEMTKLVPLVFVRLMGCD